MKAHKGREINKEKKVQVYFNLHLKKFSIKQDGLVVAHAEKVNLKEVTFKVSEAGRQRVLKEKKKNVHATVTGYLTDIVVQEGTDVTYNPYKYSTFVEKESGKEIHQAAFATLHDKQMTIKGA